MSKRKREAGFLAPRKRKRLQLASTDEQEFSLPIELFVRIGQECEIISLFMLYRSCKDFRNALYPVLIARAEEIRKLWALQNKFIEFKLAEAAAKHGFISVVKYIYECAKVDYTKARLDHSLLLYRISYVASKNGHVDCIKYARDEGCEWACQAREAASNGHLECLKFALANGCSLDTSISTFATINGHLDCLKYYFEFAGISHNHSSMECRQHLAYLGHLARQYKQPHCFEYIVHK